MPRRFPPPWSIDEQTESFIVKDATGLPIAGMNTTDTAAEFFDSSSSDPPD
jgi:hypothetical protein